MAGTITADCPNCGQPIDYDPLLGGRQYCDDCAEREAYEADMKNIYEAEMQAQEEEDM